MQELRTDCFETSRPWISAFYFLLSCDSTMGGYSALWDLADAPNRSYELTAYGCIIRNDAPERF